MMFKVMSKICYVVTIARFYIDILIRREMRNQEKQNLRRLNFSFKQTHVDLSSGPKK